MKTMKILRCGRDSANESHADELGKSEKRKGMRQRNGDGRERVDRERKRM